MWEFSGPRNILSRNLEWDWRQDARRWDRPGRETGGRRNDETVRENHSAETDLAILMGRGCVPKPDIGHKMSFRSTFLRSEEIGDVLENGRRFAASPRAGNLPLRG